MDKVKELVEWAARELCFIDGSKWEYIPSETMSLFDGVISKKTYRIRAKMLLSHPDLALIDREKKPPDKPINISSFAYGHTIKNLESAGWKPVIPLKEELEKEEKG